MFKKILIKIVMSLALLQSTCSIADDKIDPTLVSELKKSIVDEIYANNIQAEFLDVGDPISETKRKLRIYIKPALQSGKGWVIYKLMPVGEVSRMFTVSKNAGVLLYGEIDDGFPPTQPSYRTVYMSDDQLSDLKKNWLIDYIEIDLSPSKTEIQNATSRQLKRFPNR